MHVSSLKDQPSCLYILVGWLVCHNLRAGAGRKESETKTSAPIEAWKGNFSPSYENMTDQPTDQCTGNRGHREVTVPISGAY